MDDQPRQILQDLLARHGLSLADDPQRVEGLLRDRCGGHRREISVLVDALKERVADDLRGSARSLPPPVLLARLSERLQEERGLAAEPARWAVESWALALGVIASAELTPEITRSRRDKNKGSTAPKVTGPAPQQAGRAKSQPRQRAISVGPPGQASSQTIGEALRRAAPGERILVQPGLYREELILDRPIELVGDGPLEHIIIEGRNGPAIRIHADGVEVRGLSLRQRGEEIEIESEQERTAIVVGRGQSIVEDCDVSSDFSSGVGTIGPAASPTIRRCRIHSCGRVGIYVESGSRALIEENDVSGNAWAGVYVSDDATATLQRNTIHENRQPGVTILGESRAELTENDIFGNGHSGVDVDGEATATLHGNTIYENQTSGVWVHAKSKSQLAENDIFGNAYAGVKVDNEASSSLRSNRIHDNRSEGVWVEGSGKAELDENDIFGNVGAGVYLDSRNSSPTLRANRVHDGQGVGIHVGRYSEGLLEDNDIYGNAGDGVAIDEDAKPTLRRNRIHDGRSTGVAISGSSYSYGVEYDRITIEENEIFANAATGVHIQHGSGGTLRRNRIHDGADAGVVVSKGGKWLLEENEIFGNSGAGIVIEYGADVKRKRNTVHDNKGADIDFVGPWTLPWLTYDRVAIALGILGGILIPVQLIVLLMEIGNAQGMSHRLFLAPAITLASTAMSLVGLVPVLGQVFYSHGLGQAIASSLTQAGINPGVALFGSPYFSLGGFVYATGFAGNIIARLAPLPARRLL